MTKKQNTIRIYVAHLFIVAILVGGLHSCKEKKTPSIMEREPVVAEDTSEDFIEIFDGKTLDGWHGDSTYWSVNDGSIVGEVTPTTLLKSNTFLVWEGGEPEDFELKLEFRIEEAGNSGINYRSESVDSIPHALRGYQADIDGKIRYTGQNYEERKRATLAYRGEKVIISSQENPNEAGSLRANVKNNCWQFREVIFEIGESDTLKTKIKFEDWNTLHLIVQGNRMRHFVNDVLMSEVQDDDLVNRKLKGKLGMQVHVGPPMKVQYKNIRMKNL